eukprot:jgi/Pico_ML_1/52816/g3467.t2
MALDDEARDDLEVERVASNEEEESGSEESVHEDAGTETTKEKTSRWKKKKHKRKESKGSDLSPRHSFQLDWTKPMKRSSMVLRKAYRGLHHKFAEFGHVPAEKQLQAVESLRFMLASEGLLRMEYDEYALHRFLRARQFNVEKALEMIKKNIRWREENQVEHIGYYKTDKQGRPIYYQKLGGVTWKKLTAVTTVERFLKYHIREYEKLFNSDARNLLKNIAAIDSDNYPEMMGRMVIINAPTSFKMVYAVVKTFIDKRTASKIEIYGDVLGVDASKVRAGRGTSLQDGCLVACLLGDATVEGNEASVRPWNGGARVPNVGDVVTARVRKINRRLASCDVLCVGSAALRERFSGIVRVQDVRATEIDKVNMVESFRPGDVVRAVVLSMGDTRSYYLSTARNDLGVIYAESRGGVRMVPKSWEEMQCPKTKLVEKRKVAKIAIHFESTAQQV